MSRETVALEDFLADAVAVLQETEERLQQLARQAILEYGQAPEAARNSGLAVRLPHISRQFAALSEQSKTLYTYLENGVEAPPVDDSYWPQIRILQSQEEERTKLARELENSVGQLLANAVFELASCRQLLRSNDEEAVRDGLTALQTELEQGLSHIRHFIADLEPATILGTFGLGAGIRRYLEQYETRTGLKARLWVNANMGRLPSLIEIAIFRVIREALNNVYRHANASEVEVVFEEKDGRLEFSVIDNGAGITADKVDGARKSLGLARMVDYAELLGGQLRVLTEPGRGTQVILSIPYPAV